MISDDICSIKKFGLKVPKRETRWENWETLMVVYQTATLWENFYKGAMGGGGATIS